MTLYSTDQCRFAPRLHFSCVYEASINPGMTYLTIWAHLTSIMSEDESAFVNPSLCDWQFIHTSNILLTPTYVFSRNDDAFVSPSRCLNWQLKILKQVQNKVIYEDFMIMNLFSRRINDLKYDPRWLFFGNSTEYSKSYWFDVC